MIDACIEIFTIDSIYQAAGPIRDELDILVKETSSTKQLRSHHAPLP